jgi:5'-3' exonuclease
MGIPSYFRKILQKYPGCCQNRAPENISGIYFDFNCLIYRCLKNVKMEWSEEKNEEWEEELLEEVKKTVKEVIREGYHSSVGATKKIYLALDGVVPMAKIRQQRVRRFKSAWLRERGGGEGWDTNAITPGTKFMDKVARKLEGNGWEVSGVREAGEGEHKIMRKIREEESGNPAPLLVYGLDADLIILTMLVGDEKKRTLWLMREEQEFQWDKKEDKEKIQKEQAYTYMNMNEFRNRNQLKTQDHILNYVALMTLMGNDFLPHSITHKLGDDGHEYVMEELRRMMVSKGKWLVKEGKIDVIVLREIAGRWAEDETEKCFTMIRKKREQAGRGVLRGMDEIEGKPLEWLVEKELIDEEGQLLENWREVYATKWIRHDAKEICREYVKGCQWVLDYYLGKEVDKGWMFRSWIPPLWSALRDTLEDTLEIGYERGWKVEAEEQLAMVLPLRSWGLIHKKEHRKLPIQSPQMWPKEFGYFSLGRKWLWECEAMIPVLTAEYLREILKN